MHPGGRFAAGGEQVECRDGRAVALVQQLVSVVKGKHGDVVHAGADEDQRRLAPGRQAAGRQRLHDNFEAPHIGSGKPGRLDALSHHARASHIHCDDGLEGGTRGSQHGQGVHHRSIHAVSPADFPRRKNPGERARRENGVRHPDVPESRTAPQHLRATVQIHGIDEERVLELIECHVPNEALEQQVQWFLAVDRRRPHPSQSHVGVRDLKHVPLPDGASPHRHLGGAHAGGPCRAHQGSHAGPNHERGLEPALMQRPQHTNVRQALHSTTA